jgi:hypothetical protein
MSDENVAFHSLNFLTSLNYLNPLIPHLHYPKAAVLLALVGFGFVYFGAYTVVAPPAVHMPAEPRLYLLAVWRYNSTQLLTLLGTE